MKTAEQLRIHNHQYYEEHKEQLRVKSRQNWYKNLAHNLAITKLYNENHRREKREWQRTYQLALKIKVLTYYGNGKLACVRCGESRLACLSIDHIDGSGYKHRTKSLCAELKREGFPIGYQTLCMNCQFVKRWENNECKRQN